MVHGVKVLERLLDRLVTDIGAVEDTAPGGTGAELPSAFLPAATTSSSKVIPI